MSFKGKFKPKNPQKYKGDPTNIIYRSSWEFKLLVILDTHPDVLEYASEELIIPYISPLDNNVHRYFPDFWVKRKNTNGIVETLLIEVKPFYQTQKPEKSLKQTKKYITDVANWAVNSAKWKAAEKYCKQKNWKFMLLTEKQLFGKNGK